MQIYLDIYLSKDKLMLYLIYICTCNNSIKLEGECLIRISKLTEKWVKKRTQPRFFNHYYEVTVWIPDETFFQVFDIAFKLIIEYLENKEIKSPKSV